jgi:hypothetical protein
MIGTFQFREGVFEEDTDCFSSCLSMFLGPGFQSGLEIIIEFEV